MDSDINFKANEFCLTHFFFVLRDKGVNEGTSKKTRAKAQPSVSWMPKSDVPNAHFFAIVRFCLSTVPCPLAQ